MCVRNAMLEEDVEGLGALMYMSIFRGLTCRCLPYDQDNS